MQRLRMGSLAFIACLPATAGASSVSVDDGIYKLGPAPKVGDRLPVTGPVFHVYSNNGQQYDFVGQTNRNLTFVTTLTGFCSGARKADDGTVEIAGVTESKYIGGGYSDLHKEQFVVSVPHSKLKSFDAVKACNDGLQTLKARTGRTASQLIAQGFSLRYEDAFEANARLYCSRGAAKGQIASDRSPVDVWVNCAAKPSGAGKPPQDKGKPDQKPARAPKRAVFVPLVRRLEFSVDKPFQIGTCPASLQFNGRIVSNRAGIVRYRTVAHDGSRSPIFGLKFDGPGAKKISPWGETFPAPDPSQRLSSGSGTRAPDYKGWRRLEIVDPKGVPPSAKAEYSVICGEPMKVQPLSPKPDTRPARKPVTIQQPVAPQ